MQPLRCYWSETTAMTFQNSGVIKGKVLDQELFQMAEEVMMVLEVDMLGLLPEE